MKKTRENEADRVFSWEEFEREHAQKNSIREEKAKMEWDRPLVDESWQLEEPIEEQNKSIGALTKNLPSEDAIVNAMLEENLDLSTAISQKLNAVAEAPAVDTQLIRSSVDRKIVVQSEELKEKRAKQEEGRKRKVRRRIPRQSEPLPQPEDENALRKSPSFAPNRDDQREETAEMSRFREESMHWKAYDTEHGGKRERGDFIDPAPSGTFLRLNALQWVSVLLAVIVVLSAAMTTAVYADYRSEYNKARALETLREFTTEEAEEILQTVSQEEEPLEQTTEIVEQEIKTLSLVLTSVEKDLKIKLVDQDDMLVKGIDWGVTVTDADGKISENEDEDRDGIIYLTDMSAGDYSVALNPSAALADYVLPASSQMVSVKAKIEYKVIANIKDEIKSEKEVNAAVEDNGNRAADVETGKLTDTVEWVESTKTANGEEYIETEVYLKNTRAAKVVKRTLADAFASIAGRIGNGSRNVIGMPLLLATTGGEAKGEKLTGELDPPAEPTSAVVKLEKTDFSINVGETVTLKASVTPDEYTVDWSIKGNKTDVVTVDSNGTVTGVAEGTATVVATATDGKGGFAEATVTVKKQMIPVSGITLSASSTEIKVRETVTVSAALTPDNASDKTLTWTSDKTEVATVDNGVVTGVAAGTATIKATANDGSKISGSIKIKVTAAADPAAKITKIALSPKEVSVPVKSNQQLSIKLTPNELNGASLKDKVEWKSANTAIATVSEVPGGAVITGVAEGKTTITAEAKDGSKVVSNTVSVTVTPEEKYAHTDQLFDKDNNKLYKYAGGKYVLATYGDYRKDKAIKLFKKADAFLYTGWQTIDGKTYYYKRDNTYVTGDQVIGGVTYHFATDGTLTQGSGTLGIDVSKYQPSINWSSVKASGVSFVIIRCGYRGSSTGVLIQDPYFTSHMKGAKAAGLKVGVYFFTTAINEAEAIEEASMCAYLCSSYGINYPVFMDCESSPRPGYNSIGAAERTRIIQAFCNTMKSAGYTPGVYANKTWLTEKMIASSLSGYKIWLAQYNAAGPTYNGRYDLWQYTSKGSVSGIPGNVDMNKSFLGY